MSEDMGKQRLRPFLEAQINGGKIQGLCWLNKEKTKFRIPWWHGGKPDWNPEHGQIFKEWAVHTGRYREGIDEADWVSWKTRLRCALNKAQDIVECKAESRVKAEDYDPYKVYELRPRQPAKKKAATAGSHVIADTAASSVVQGAPANAPVPTFVNNYKLASDDQIQERMPSDLNEVHTSELYQPETEVEVSQMSVTEADVELLLNDLDHQLAQRQASNDMELVLFYSNKSVWNQHVENTNGCRIYYGDGDLTNHFDSLPVSLVSTIFGENNADTFWLPPVDGLLSDDKMVPHVQTVLERGMLRGVLLQCRNSNIIAYRLCKCSIFYASSLGTAGEPVKLPLVLRDSVTDSVEPTVIFDYKSWFLPALNEFALNGGPPPDPRVFLLIGTKKKLSEIDESVPIYATIACRRALSDLTNISHLLHSRQQAVQKHDVDDVISEVKQMSLDSVDMTTGITTAVPGYGFLPDTGLLPGNFIDPGALQAAEFPDVIFDEKFAGGDNDSDPSSFLPTADVNMWSQFDVPATIDVTEFEDLMVFYQ